MSCPPPRHRLPAAILILAILVVAVLLLSEPETKPPTQADPVDRPVEAPPPPPVRPPVTAHPSLEMAGRFLAPGGEPREDVEILETLIGDFARALGGNPIGENEEIVAALQGENAKGLRFFPAQHPALAPDGKLLDRWGTPWVFHALSGRHMEILSAGPDRQTGTQDDLHGQGGG